MKRISRISCLILSVLMIVMSSVAVFAANSEENSLFAELGTAEKTSGMVGVSAPYPFEFVVSTTNENTAFISFVPDVDTDYTFYLGVRGERTELFKINRTQYMVEVGVEYSFAYSYTMGDDMTVYNGTLLVTADDAGITVTPTGVVKNVTYAGDITEAVKTSYFAANSRASGTVNESESNNTMATADRTYDDYDSFGTLGSSSDVDWWKVSFTMSGTANFWLGSIPSGCNYDISVYSQAGMLLGESYNSGTTAELVQIDVTAGTYYYIKVDSAASSSSSQYLLRVKNYASATLSVPLYRQETDSTCGSASGRMMLAAHNVNISESTFKARADIIAGIVADYTTVWVIKDTINHFLSQNNISVRYKYTDVSSHTLAEYQNLVLNNIMNGHPVQPNIAISSSIYFPYQTDGHYVVIKGVVYNSSIGAYNTIVNDPHDLHCNIYTVPLSAMLSYTHAHSSGGFLIHVND